jgi:hypothetical protein
MADPSKKAHMQIRVSSREKSMIAKAAKRANMSMSAWLLSKALPSQKVKFHQLLHELLGDEHNRYAFAELNDLLSDLSPEMFSDIVADKPEHTLTPFAQNYLSAMIELAAANKCVNPPVWTKQIPPMEYPYFGTRLKSLRLYLLTHSPAVFRRRNIFIDASLGDRV